MPPPIAPPAALPDEPVPGVADAAWEGAVGATVSALTAGDMGIEGPPPPPPAPPPAPPAPNAAGLRLGSVADFGTSLAGPPGSPVGMPPDGAAPPDGEPPPEGAPPPDGAPPPAGEPACGRPVD